MVANEWEVDGGIAWYLALTRLGHLFRPWKRQPVLLTLLACLLTCSPASTSTPLTLLFVSQVIQISLPSNKLRCCLTLSFKFNADVIDAEADAELTVVAYKQVKQELMQN